jgi:putative restriction endonuclease
MATADQWLTKIANLKRFQNKRGFAPHKPILLLVVLELAEQGLLPKKKLPLTPELAFRFYSYWNIVVNRWPTKPDVRFPFHYLQTDGFWSALAEDGNPSPDNRLTRYADLCSDFVACANDPAFREKARRILIAKYFPPKERIALYTLVGLPVPDDEGEKDANFKSQEEAQKQGRETRFRLNIVAAYNYTCALTQYRLTTVTGGCIVDAAHIHQFADGHNNDPDNGLALSKNAHWLFDNGMWTLSDDYRVIIAHGSFAEAGPAQHLLAQYSGQKIQLPSDPSLWPNLLHIAWHRKKKFKGP